MPNSDGIVEEILGALMDCIRSMRDMATSPDQELSPKQRKDAATAVGTLSGQVLDRYLPRLNATQQTNLNVDMKVTKALAQVLSPEQLAKLEHVLSPAKSKSLPEPIDAEFTSSAESTGGGAGVRTDPPSEGGTGASS